MKLFLFVLLVLGVQFSASAQNLSNSTIFKIGNSKKAVFHSSGTFHNGGVKGRSTLKGIRHSYSATRGYERVVMDFTTENAPKIYGHIASDEKKIYIDLYDTEIRPFGKNTFGNSVYVQEIQSFPFSGDSLAMEILLDIPVTADIFTLNSPGRLVIDIKKN